MRAVHRSELYKELAVAALNALAAAVALLQCGRHHWAFDSGNFLNWFMASAFLLTMVFRLAAFRNRLRPERVPQ